MSLFYFTGTQNRWSKDSWSVFVSIYYGKYLSVAVMLLSFCLRCFIVLSKFIWIRELQLHEVDISHIVNCMYKNILYLSYFLHGLREMFWNVIMA